jgi:enoyl-CoA hydratase
MELKTVRFATVVTSQGLNIGVIKIARPEALNALNAQVLSDLAVVLKELSERRDLRAAILTGEGEKAFVAGADIKEMEKLSAAAALDMALNGQALLQKIEDLPVPVIGALNGFALGGGLEIALACDFLLASDKCKWGLPEVTLGLIPGYGGTQRLSRVLGGALAKRVALSGEIFSAQQGYEWGLFTRVVQHGDLMTEALKLAETVASRAPRALAWVKEAVNRGRDMTLADGLRLEAELFARTFETKDRHEGIKAFIEKRSPRFEGH